LKYIKKSWIAAWAVFKNSVKKVKEAAQSQSVLGSVSKQFCLS
jgi:hypothetical protein